MKFLFLILLMASPVYADAMPDGNTPDPGATAKPSESKAWAPDGTKITNPVIGAPIKGAPIAQSEPTLVDGGGREYRPSDVGRGMFIPIPNYIPGGYNYVAYGGGLARRFDGPPPGAPLPPGLPPDPNDPTDPTTPTTPVDPIPPRTDVPGPVGILGLGAFFAYSRRLRNRLGVNNSSHRPNLYNSYLPD